MPNAGEKVAFAREHRSLIVKRTARLTGAGRQDLTQPLAYLPELRLLGSFSQDR